MSEIHISYHPEKGMVPADRAFYNAIGTDGAYVDVNGTPENPINAWEDLTGIKRPEECPNVNCTSGPVSDDNPIVGAHVVVGKKPTTKIQSGDTCYIVPICNGCNASKGNIVIKFEQRMPALRLMW